LTNKSLCIDAVLFDFDGTLTKPGALDFFLLKQTLGCPPDSPVLEFIENRPTAGQRAEALALTERFESIAAANSEPNEGAEELIQYLRSKGIALGIISRNSLGSIKRTLQNFATVSISDFDLVITRDTPVKPKPHPDGVFMAAQRLKVDVSRLLLVGDFVFDIQAGQAAGSMTVFLDNGLTSGPCKITSDFRISCLPELKKIVRLF